MERMQDLERVPFSNALTLFVFYLSFSGCYFIYCLFALVVVRWDLTGLLAEAGRHGLLPASPVCLSVLSPSLDMVLRLLRLWELSLSVFSEAPCFWWCNATSVLRKVILDTGFTCSGFVRTPRDLGVIAFPHFWQSHWHYSNGWSLTLN